MKRITIVTLIFLAVVGFPHLAAAAEDMGMAGVLRARDDLFGGCSFALLHVDLLSAALRASDQESRLLLALDDDDPTVRLEALRDLIDSRSAGAVEALSAVALLDPNAVLREEALLGLGEIGEARALQIFERAFHDPDRRVREAAISAITDIGMEGSAEALAFALGDVESILREEAVYALGEIGGEQAMAVLQQALADEDEAVRKSAAEVLAELRP